MADAPNNEPFLVKYAEIASNNFAITSALATIMIAFITTLSLYSYLAVFDSSLIWLIEYQDVIKLCLVGVALMSGSFLVIYSFADGVSYHMKAGRKPLVFAGLIVFSLVLSFSINIYMDYNSSYPKKEYHIFLFASSLLIFFIVYAMINIIERDTWRGRRTLTNAVLVMLLSSYVFGRTHGLYVRDVSREYHSFVISERADQLEAFDKAKFVFVTSHHTIIFGEERTITLQSADIKQMTSLPQSPSE